MDVYPGETGVAHWPSVRYHRRQCCAVNLQPARAAPRLRRAAELRGERPLRCTGPGRAAPSGPPRPLGALAASPLPAASALLRAAPAPVRTPAAGVLSPHFAPAARTSPPPAPRSAPRASAGRAAGHAGAAEVARCSGGV